jgi:hypothetical protein
MVEIKKLLKADKEVLFSGTPCQVAGLKKFLGRNYEKLTTVGIVCHGVPSPMVFHKFLGELHDGHIKSVNFREKDVIGWCTGTTVKYTDGYVYRQPDRTCHWFRGFLYNYFLNRICGECPFSAIPRQEDISLADYWRIREWDPKLQDGKGTGLVLLNNDRGKEMFQHIAERLSVCVETSMECALESNPNLAHTFTHSKDREKFFTYLKDHSYEETFQHLRNPKYDVCIVGLGYANNYGGVLTNYALTKTLEDLGKSVLMMERFKEYACGVNLSVAIDFNHKYLNVSEAYDENSVRLLNDQADIFIVGSDQLWNAMHLRNFYRYFLLSFTDDNKKRIAYASSLGKDDINLTPSEKNAFKYLFSRFDAISVRESNAVEWFKKLNIESEHVLDPVFMCDRSHYDRLVQEAGDPPQDPYVFAYILDPKQGGNKFELVNAIASHKGLPAVIEQDLFSETGSLEKRDSSYSFKIERFISHIYHSDFVVTDSFHGACFCIIFRKPFICVANTWRGVSRFESLFIRLNLENRLFYSVESAMQHLDVLQESIPYDQVDSILAELKTKSLAFLTTALDSPKQNKKTDSIPFDDLTEVALFKTRQHLDFLDRKIYELKKHDNSFPHSIWKKVEQKQDCKKVKFLGGAFKKVKTSNKTKYYLLGVRVFFRRRRK